MKKKQIEESKKKNITKMLSLSEEDDSDKEEEKKKKKLEKRKASHTFVLQNVSASKAEKEHFGDKFDSFFEKKEDPIVSKLRSQLEGLQVSNLKTPPDDTITEKTIQKMNLYLCGVTGKSTVINMIDQTSKKRLPDKTGIVCRNCTEPFKTRPLGHPIKYYPSVIRVVTKDLSGNEMIMNKEISRNERKKMEKEGLMEIVRENGEKNGENKEIRENKKEGKQNKSTSKLIIREYYDTIYNFCSVSCMLRYGHTNRHILMFKDKVPLIRMMVKHSVELALDEWQDELKKGKKGKSLKRKDKKEEPKLDTFLLQIGAAPHVDLLSKFGGPLDIDEYRSTPQDYPKIVFTCQQQVMKNGKACGNIRPVGLVYEQYEC